MLVEIARALEARDRTEGHGARVAALAEPVAMQLGWDDGRIGELRFGAAVHDIGKLTVREEVLCKVGPLALDEVDEIRQHPRAGAALVMHSAHRALPYVLFHHERWDGYGYPSGLAGESIPIEGRLLAVADAYDAMTSLRAYRRSLSSDGALRELAHCAGTQFDPRIVEAFLDVWGELLQVAV